MHANLSVCSFTYAGVAICIAANFAVAIQMSLTGEAKHKLKLDAINTIVFTSAQVFSHDIYDTHDEIVRKYARVHIVSLHVLIPSSQNAQICLLITPFIFITGEHKIVASIVQEHASVLGGCIAVGSVIVLVYLAVSIHVIQETTSFFVSIAANFKMVPIIILSELLVQNS